MGQEQSDMLSFVSSEGMGDVPFSETGFTTADGLVFAQLSYIDWSGAGINCDLENKKISDKMSLSDAIGLIIEKYKGRADDSDDARDNHNYELLRRIATSKRYKDVQVSNFFQKRVTYTEADGDHERVEQVASVTLSYIDESGNTQNYISYRGTDGTLEGWGEDFVMAYDDMTEAQRDSVRYFNLVSEHLAGAFQTGGHSKGGNLAMYAMLFSTETASNKLTGVYNYDGPGFTPGIQYTDEDQVRHGLTDERMKRLLDLMKDHSVCPYDSVIGQLLRETPFIFVDTTAGILLDHDPYTWRLDPTTGKFCEREQSDLSCFLDETFDEWIYQVPRAERRQFMTAIWDWIYHMGVSSFDGIGEQFQENVWVSAWGAIAHIGDLPLEQKTGFLKGLSWLYICVASSYLANTVNCYGDIKDRFQSVTETFHLETRGDVLDFILEDPISHSFAFLQEMLVDVSFLGVLRNSWEQLTSPTLLQNIGETSIAFVKGAVGLGAITLVSSLLAALIISALVVHEMFKRWEQLAGFINLSAEFVQDKIHEMVSAVKLAVTERAHEIVRNLQVLAKQIAEGAQYLKNAIGDTIEVVGNFTERAVRQAMQITAPLLYSLARTISGASQEPITIDVARLQEAVDSMERLAQKVADIDNRLSGLYSKLCQSNIEQGEGIFVSLVNLYHLAWADINVDEGQRVRRKANAIRTIFDDCRSVEKWALSKIE